MKKLLLVFIVLFSISRSYSQSMSIMPFAGYMCQESLYYGYYDIKIRGSAHYGGALEYKLDEYYGIEVYYMQQDTKVDVVDHSGISTDRRNFKGRIGYLMIGGSRYQPIGTGKVEGFGGVNLGPAFLKNKDNNNDATRFAIGLKAGLKINASEQVGIKLQGNLNSVIEGAGTSAWLGTGGSGVSVNTYSSIVQFAVTGGLIFTFAY